MVDYRENILSTIKSKLSGDFDYEQISKIADVIISSLKDYNVSKKSTELAIPQDRDGEIVKAFLGTLLSEGKSRKTVKLYGLIIKRFSNDINKSLLEVNPFDFRLWFSKLQQTISLRTCENYRSYLSSFYRWLEAEEIVQKNPMAKISPIKYVDEIKLPFNDVEIDAMRGSCKSLRDRAIFELLISSGIRVSELCAMDISDVNFDRMEILIRSGKGGKQRTSFISDICKKHLILYLESRQDNCESLFITKNKKRISKASVENEIKNIGIRSNIDKAHPHRCRRTFATNLSKKGMNLSSIQRLMGHSNVNITMGYIYSATQQIENEYRRCS